MKLTQQIVDDAVYEGRSHRSKSGRKRWSQHILWDERLPGFGVRITATNRKSYVVSHKVEGRKRTKTLGRADKLSLKKARVMAVELLSSASEQEVPKPAPPAADPATVEDVEDAPIERAESVADGSVDSAPEIETVAQLADTYLERHLKQTVPSWFTDQRLIRTHIKPAMGRSRISEVTQMDLASLRRRVARRFPADARRLKALLDGMFGWAAEHGLWSMASGTSSVARRQAAAAVAADARTEEARGEAEPEPEPAPLPQAEELAESLRRSEEQRRELAAQVEEVSTSGADMLAKLNEQAATQQELEAELIRSQRELQRALRQAARQSDPAKAEQQVVVLQQSVEQLMTSLDQAKNERQEMADKLAAAEARIRSQGETVASLTRIRGELEEKVREQERRAALRQEQRRSEASTGRRVAWLVAGLIGGALITLLGQWALRSGEAPGTVADDDLAPSAAVSVADTSPAPLELEPTPPPVSTAAAEPETEPGTATRPPTVAAEEPEEIVEVESVPDPAAADRAVLAWAAAWSEQRIDDYLAAYSERFVPTGSMERSAWAAQRRERILRPAWIRVTLGPLNSTVIDSERVRLSFDQSFETATYADKVVKTLELVWEDGAWRIVTERSG